MGFLEPTIMNIKKIIKEEMSRQTINGKSMSKLSGINYSTLMTFLNIESASIRLDKIEKILDVLNLGIINLK